VSEVITRLLRIGWIRGEWALARTRASIDCRGRPSKLPLSGAFQPTLASSAQEKSRLCHRSPIQVSTKILPTVPASSKVRTAPPPRLFTQVIYLPRQKRHLAKAFAQIVPRSALLQVACKSRSRAIRSQTQLARQTWIVLAQLPTTNSGVKV